MPKITIKTSTFNLVAEHALGNMVTKDAVYHNNTVTLEIDDELHDTLSAEIDDITPTIEDVIVMMCSGGKVVRKGGAVI